MEISFANEKLRRVCESTRALQRAYGKPCAKKIMSRLTDLGAAATLEDCRRLPGRCHELTGSRSGQLALDLADGKRLVIEPVDTAPPLKEDGGLDWRGVDAVRVLNIVDYH